jgi:tRNA pseudouridine38-40 synthase
MALTSGYGKKQNKSMKFKGRSTRGIKHLIGPFPNKSEWQKKEAAFLGLESPDHLTQTTHIVDTLYHKKGSTNIMFLWFSARVSVTVPLRIFGLSLSATMNYKITLAYDGTNYEGWQMQREKPTIQLAVTQAASKIEGAPVIIHAAGRTDAGVHAEGQVVSCQLSQIWEPRKLRNALNGNLPHDIRVTEAIPVDEEFHARFSAHSKTYRYQIYNSDVWHPLLEKMTWHISYQLDPEKLQHEAQALIGTHDFSGFTVASCMTKTNIRTITDFQIKSEGALLQLFFKGRGFLRYQVRTMVMALVEINRGRIQLSMEEIIARQERRLIRGTAPAKGLTLMSVEY